MACFTLAGSPPLTFTVILLFPSLLVVLIEPPLAAGICGEGNERADRRDTDNQSHRVVIWKENWEVPVPIRSSCLGDTQLR